MGGNEIGVTQRVPIPWRPAGVMGCRTQSTQEPESLRVLHVSNSLQNVAHDWSDADPVPHLGLAGVNTDACVDPQLLLHGCARKTNSGWSSGQMDVVQERQETFSDTQLTCAATSARCPKQNKRASEHLPAHHSP